MIDIDLYLMKEPVKLTLSLSDSAVLCIMQHLLIIVPFFMHNFHKLLKFKTFCVISLKFGAFPHNFDLFFKNRVSLFSIIFA